ncbi:MAG: hypothetical protein ACREOZ_04505, partial [Gloeomargaritales cyanobacterium]
SAQTVPNIYSQSAAMGQPSAASMSHRNMQQHSPDGVSGPRETFASNNYCLSMTQPTSLHHGGLTKIYPTKSGMPTHPNVCQMKHDPTKGINTSNRNVGQGMKQHPINCTTLANQAPIIKREKIDDRRKDRMREKQPQSLHERAVLERLLHMGYLNTRECLQAIRHVTITSYLRRHHSV